MRFSLVKADKNSEAGVLPSQQMLADMDKFNEARSRPVMLAAEEQASSKGRGEVLR
jgi:hypothetical protein